MNGKQIADSAFWEHYWRRLRLPSVVDKGFSFERCLAAHLVRQLSGCRGDVLDIGCAPGKWMALLSRECGLRPSGIEYSDAGYAATARNLDMLGVEYGRLWKGDFLSVAPDRTFDVVLSLGFIEHFTDPDAVIDRHLEWLKPGGVLILGVPNFRGIYRRIQAVLDASVLEKHNLGVMSLEYFREIALRFALSPEFLGYIGSFEPLLPIPREQGNTAGQTVVKGLLYGAILLRRRYRFLDRVNHPWFSSYILAVFRSRAKE